MSSAPVFSKNRDLDSAGPVLEAWLAERLNVGAVTVDEFRYPVGAGVSNETILFQAKWTIDGTSRCEDLVLRVHPSPQHQLFMNPQFRNQFDLLEALGRISRVKVPGVRWYESDASLLGQPFFVMERFHGRVPVSMPVYNAEGWLFDAKPSERRRLWLSAMDQFCEIHSTSFEDLKFLEQPERGQSGLDQQRAYWRECIRWGLGDELPDPLIEIEAWLDANAPDYLEPGLTWGDARIGNMMFGDDFEVVAVMDWEQASLGGPLLDLAWWLFFDDYHSVDNGVPRLDGLGSRDETIDMWQERTGLSTHHLHWCEVFAGYQLTFLMLRNMRLSGADTGPQGNIPRPPFLARTCALLGMPNAGGAS